MAVRITPQVVTSRTINNIRRTNERVNLLQTQLQTGVRIQDPHDDPAAAAFISNQEAEDARLSTNLKNISTAQTTLNHSVDVLLNVGEQLSEARVVLLDANNVHSDPEVTAEVFAREIDGVLETIFDAANEVSTDGRALFGGTDSDDKPFTATRDANGRITSVSYNGSDQDSFARLTKQQDVPILLSGERVFQQRGTPITTFEKGVTGASAGSGTSSDTGLGTFIVRRSTDTMYDSTSLPVGVTVEDANAGNTTDTIVGNGHSLTLSVTGGVGSVQLNGGGAVSFDATNAVNGLSISGDTGESVTINITAALADGTYSVGVDQADAQASVDDGATFTDIDFTSNQVFIEQDSGKSTFVNTTGVTRTGTDVVNYAGTHDIFEVLIAIRDDILDVHNRGNRGQILTNHLGELSRVEENVARVVGEQSARAETIETLQSRVEDIQLHVRTVTSNIKDTNLSEAILSLQNEENLFQLGLAVAARVNQLSLADFLA